MLYHCCSRCWYAYNCWFMEYGISPGFLQHCEARQNVFVILLKKVWKDRALDSLMTLFFLVDRTTLVMLFRWIKTSHQLQHCLELSLWPWWTIVGPHSYLFKQLFQSCMIFILQEEVRSKLAALEVCHQNEIQRTISAFARLQKYTESRKEIDRRLDIHFQRRMYVPLLIILAFLEVFIAIFMFLQIPKKNCLCCTRSLVNNT